MANSSLWFLIALLHLAPLITSEDWTDVHENPPLISNIFGELLNQPNYLTANYKICPNFGDGIKVLMAVISAADHQEERMRIREGYGNLGNRKDVAIMFMLGLSLNGSEHNTNVEKENALYNDIMIAKFFDTYDNLTLKSLSMLLWTDIFCYKSLFLLKVDDDMSIDVDDLLNKIKNNLDPQERAIYGVQDYGRAQRDTDSNHYISYNQYGSDEGMDYAIGWAYLVPTKIAKEIYYASLKHKYIQVEDFFVTGIIRNELNISMIDNKIQI